MRIAESAAPADAGAGDTLHRPTPEAVRAQLERLRAHAFTGSDKLYAFLCFVVEEALAGRAATLKELVIGVELYGGVVDYDPRIDSAVRVEARRLRRKLAVYYAGPGRDDAVIVSIPTGGYAPSFHLREDAPCAAVEAAGAALEPPMLAVLPFTALCIHEKAFAAGVTDEIIYAAERDARLRVAARAIMFQFRESRYSLDEVAAHAGSDLVLHGTIRRVQAVHRVCVELSSRWGQILWSDRIDIVGEGDLDVQERMAEAILERLPRDALREPGAQDIV
jgi:TolB-like protein